MRHIFADKVINLGFSAAFFLTIIHTTILVIMYNKLPPVLPLYNQLPWGQPRLGTKNEFFLPLIIVLSLLVVNLLICENIYAKMPLVARILSQTSLLISFLALFFIIRTILLIT